MDKKNSYAPTYFNPFSTANAARALVDAIHHLVTEGEMIERPLPKHALEKLQALMDLLQSEVQALHEYLCEIENNTVLDLPLTEEEFEAIAVERNTVREERSRYAVR